MSTYYDYKQFRLQRQYHVTYECNDECGRRQTMDNLFFCEHCSLFSCEECSVTEIESYFCPQCLNTPPTTNAFQDKNCCQRCLECPRCFHTLTMTHSATNSAEFFLVCEYCKWDSLELKITHEKISGLTAAVKDKSKDDSTAYSDLLEVYRERVRKIKKEETDLKNISMGIFDEKPTLRRHTSNLQEVVMTIDEKIEKKRQEHYTVPESNADNSHFKPAPAYLSEEKDFNVYSVTSLEQRLARPTQNPDLVEGLLPTFKRLMAKTAHRCRTCHKYVVKPKIGTNPNDNFDRHSFATMHAPILSISLIEKGQLKPGSPVPFTLYFKNPAHADVTLTLEEAKNTTVNCDIGLPFGKNIVMDAYDELAWQTAQEGGAAKESAHANSAETKYVSSRFLSKVGLQATLTPLEAGKDIEVSFYVNLSAAKDSGASFEKFRFLVGINFGQTDE